MGRHPVKPAVVRGPARLPQFLLLLLLFVALLSSLPVTNSRSFLNATTAEPDDIQDTYFEEEEVPQLSAEEIERLKKRILEGLGLKRIPDVRKMNVSQEEYERKYNMYLSRVDDKRRTRSRREALDEEPVTAHRFYTFKHSDQIKNPRFLKGYRRESSILFNFPVDLPEARQGHEIEVDHATLRLFVAGIHPEEAARRGNTVNVRVFLISDTNRLLVDQRQVYLAPIDSKWTEFDLTHTVESWLNSDSKNITLEVVCLECSSRDITLVSSDTRISPVLNVLVNVHMGNGRMKRSSAINSKFDSYRQNKHVECRKPHQRCCRHTMEVIFNDIGFSFIKQPKSFDAGYCKGRCPPNFNPAHDHALLQYLVTKQNRAPRPCCAPSKLETLEILHADEESSEKLTISEWEKVRVVECACS